MFAWKIMLVCFNLTWSMDVKHNDDDNDDDDDVFLIAINIVFVILVNQFCFE